MVWCIKLLLIDVDVDVDFDVGDDVDNVAMRWDATASLA